jgi:fido (protein-threonine AMPylation protein)
MLHPKFAEETILACPIPSQMGNDAAALWLAICGSREFPIFLSTLPIGVEEQAVLAARRILKLEELYQTTDGSQWPTLLILLSECHFLLNDTPGARMMVEEAQAILGLGRDESLDQCLDILKAIETSETLDDGGTGDEELDEIIYYERPPVYVPSTQPSNLIRLQMRWATMKAENDGAEQFARLACVETNELENVFDLDGDSAMKLARCGFFANSIAGISHQSRIKKKDKILRILENTQRCFNITKQNCFEKNSVLECFAKKSVIVLHALLMKESKVELDEIEYPKYTPTGRYRHAFGYTTQENVNGGVTEVRYCPAVDIEEHMDWYLRKVQEILSAPEQDMDPFRAAAWIQWAFVRIHPFVDGNGRMCRLLSSIPLILNDLPPVYVSKASKTQYLQVLTKADEDGDIDELASFLQEEVFNALGQLLSENNVDVDKAELELLRTLTAATSSSSETSSLSDNTDTGIYSRSA